MKILLRKLGNFSQRQIVLTIDSQEVPVRIFLSLAVLWGSILSAGCQANSVDAGAPFEVTPSPVTEPVATTAPILPASGDAQMTSTPPIPADAGLQSLIDKARMDLAQQLSIPMTQINLIQTISATWPDSSLGCPQPGMAYSQVLTPGYLIQLQADNRVYEYHTDADQLVVFCGENTIEYPVKPGDITDDKPWMR
jgi:hypothetical protein